MKHRLARKVNAAFPSLLAGGATLRRFFVQVRRPKRQLPAKSGIAANFREDAVPNGRQIACLNAFALHAHNMGWAPPTATKEKRGHSPRYNDRERGGRHRARTCDLHHGWRRFAPPKSTFSQQNMVILPSTSTIASDLIDCSRSKANCRIPLECAFLRR